MNTVEEALKELSNRLEKTKIIVFACLSLISILSVYIFFVQEKPQEIKPKSMEIGFLLKDKVDNLENLLVSRIDRLEKENDFLTNFIEMEKDGYIDDFIKLNKKYFTGGVILLPSSNQVIFLTVEDKENNVLVTLDEIRKTIDVIRGK